MDPQSFDPTLLARLSRPLREPCLLVRMALVERIFDDTRSLHERLWLSARLMLRRAVVAFRADLPIVHAQPFVAPQAAHATEVVSATVRERLVVSTHRVIERQAASAAGEARGPLVHRSIAEAHAAPKDHRPVAPVLVKPSGIVHEPTSRIIVDSPAARSPGIATSMVVRPTSADPRPAETNPLRPRVSAAPSRGPAPSPPDVPRLAQVAPRAEARSGEPPRPALVHATAAPSSPTPRTSTKAPTVTVAPPLSPSPSPSPSPSIDSPRDRPPAKPISPPHEPAARSKSVSPPPAEINLDDLAEKVQRRLMRQMAEERARRGHSR
jgi:hypothetical protein